VNTFYCLEEWRGEERISPPGDNFTPRGQLRPWGQRIGVKAEAKNWPQILLFSHKVGATAHTEKQGCQMVSFQTKNPILGKFWRVLDLKMLIYFLNICNILQVFGIFYDHLVHFVFIWNTISVFGIV
jgi:hypothetical protein